MKLTCAADEIEGLTPDRIKKILAQDRKGEFLLLDVRQPEEYEAGHIPGAILIPLGELESRQGELDRTKKIITYCRSGRRSMAAAIALCGLGFERIYSLDGGILNWPHETISGIPENKPELITETVNIRDVLMLAIKMEKGSADFYLAARDRTESPQAKETFQMLASTEDAHMKMLYQRALSLPGKNPLPPLEELKVEYMEGGIEINPALTKVEENFVDEMEALEIALEKEYMSYDFYQRASVLIVNPDAKSLLHELALEERNHADILLKRISENVRK